ncbi:MAG: hypothetical protein P1U77_03160 [Rubripirellula sp.]|nr:hypothetical protein [Rubripirellula sp.]
MAILAALRQHQDYFGRRRSGMSPIAITIAIVIAGILAVFSLPHLVRSGEQRRASESFRFLSAVREAQAHFRAEHGVYASGIDLLDLDQTAPPYFSVGRISPVEGCHFRDGWKLSLRRVGRSRLYRPYTMTFTHLGYDAPSSDLPPGIRPL